MQGCHEITLPKADKSYNYNNDGNNWGILPRITIYEGYFIEKAPGACDAVIPRARIQK